MPGTARAYGWLAQAVLGVLVFGTACGGGGTTTGPGGLVVATVTVSPGGDTLVSLGQTRQLIAVAKAANGTVITGKTFVWSSSAGGVVSVSADGGLATAVGNGQATISASVEGKTGQAVILVDQQVTTVE